MEFERTAIELGTISISTFALVVALALGVGSAVTLWRERHHGGSVDNVMLLITWAILLGVLVGRLFYVLNPPPSVAGYYDWVWYRQHPLDLQVGPLAVWSGGLGQGGIAVGGMMALGWVAWRRRLDFTQWVDRLIVGLVSGLAIAPFGNLFSGLMFGPPTTLPWGITLAERFAPFDDLARYPASTRFQPTPAYFALLALVVLAGVLIVDHRWKERRPAGGLFLLGWGAYCTGAVILGIWQADVSRGILHLSGLQGVMLITAVASLGTLAWRWKR